VALPLRKSFCRMHRGSWSWQDVDAGRFMTAAAANVGFFLFSGGVAIILGFFIAGSGCCGATTAAATAILVVVMPPFVCEGEVAGAPRLVRPIAAARMERIMPSASSCDSRRETRCSWLLSSSLARPLLASVLSSMVLTLKRTQSSSADMVLSQYADYSSRKQTKMRVKMQYN